MRKIMASLDVGSNSVKLVVGEIMQKKLNILAVAEAPSKGLSEGILKNPNDLLPSLKEVIRKCEDIIGLKIHQMIVTIPCKDTNFSVVNGTVKVENNNSVITGRDVIKALKVAVHNKVPENHELISLLTTSFTLDDERVVRDPKGLTSSKLSVRGVLITEPKSNVYPILACLERLNIDVLDITVNAVGDYYEFKNKTTANNVGIIINLGAETSTISVFNKGVLTNTQVMDIGGLNIDNDIAYIYKVNQAEAKRLKEQFALAHSRLAHAKDTVECINENNEKININQYEISEIVKSRLEQILNLCKKQINHLTKKEISYIIFTGGLTEIRDFKLILEEVYGQNVTYGRINEIGVRHNKYSSCVGMIKYYADKANLKDKDFSIFSIEEQQILSGSNLDSQDENMIGKLFGYFFSN